MSIAGGRAAAGDAKVTVGIPTRNRSRWLRQAVESVLAQTYTEFRLVISDNASTDDTPAVVASFDDPRVSYHRSSVDLGMFGNLNRVSELAETEYVVVLPDDDLLYPDYLSSVVSVLERHPYVSVAHSAFDVIDEDGTVIERARVLLPSAGETTMETGPQLIERSMRRSGTVCWTSACFRTAALRAAGGIRAADGLYADGPLMMRIALHGGFCGFSRALVAVRVHPTAESASVGQFAGAAYRPLADAPGFLYRQRLAFLDEARFPTEQGTSLPATRRERLQTGDSRTSHTWAAGRRPDRVPSAQAVVSAWEQRPADAVVPGDPEACRDSPRRRLQATPRLSSTCTKSSLTPRCSSPAACFRSGLASSRSA